MVVAFFFGFLLCSYSPCQAAKQQAVVKPRYQAAVVVVAPRRQTVKLRLL